MKRIHYILAFFILLSIGLGLWVKCERNKNSELTLKDDKAKIKAISDTIWSNNDSIVAEMIKTLEKAKKADSASNANVKSLININQRLIKAINERPNEKDIDPDSITLFRLRYITRP